MAQYTTAEELAKKQRDISVAEFFERNRHLLGFDNKRKALLTVVKEAVDNSIDACEDAGILPEIQVEIIDMENDRFRVIVEDNGPGIVKKQIPNIFAKLLYGSKFHTMKQQRGQQGIGISAACLYAQLTTGRPARITSKIGPTNDAHYYELHIDTHKNQPEIVKDDIMPWSKEHGTRVELDLEATYQKGDQSVDAYLKQTAIANPHVTIVYTTPKAEQIIFARAINELPPPTKEIKPHPYGTEIGVMIKLLKNTEARTLSSFLQTEFSRVGPGTAKEICQKASLLTTMKPHELAHQQIEKLMQGIKQTKIIAPPTDCIVPIGADALEKGLKKEINAEFYASASRTPAIYRGIPFVVEAAIAYGGELLAEDTIKLLRYANRVPLLYQQSACAIFKAVSLTNWRPYGLSQSNNNLPQGPVAIAIHFASVWPPFTSEAKEALAHYPEIIRELRLTLQEIGRKLSSYISKKRKLAGEQKKRGYIEKYIPHVSETLIKILELNQKEDPKIRELLKEILESTRGQLEDIDTDNEEYDEDFASIGKEEQTELPSEDDAP